MYASAVCLPRAPTRIIRIGLREIMVASARVMVAAMRDARHDKFGVVLLAHARQLFEKCDRCPQLVVTVIAPGRHAGHLDTVLKDREKLGGAVQGRGCGEIGRRGIKAARDVTLW